MSPAPSPTATLYRGALTTLRDLLQAEMTGGGGSDWLEAVKEVRVGFHGDDKSFQSSGVYISPVRDRVTADETHAFGHRFRIRAVVALRGLTGDRDPANPMTLTLTDIVGGILDVAKENPAVDGAWTQLVPDVDDPAEADFQEVPIEGGGIAYRAEVRFTAYLEDLSVPA